MQLKRKNNLEFITLKKSHKKEIVIGALVICLIGGILTYATSRAKYQVDGNIDLVKGTVNYKVPDLRIVAINVSEDGKNYENREEVPGEGYAINTKTSICRVYDGTTSIEEAPKDENTTIEYVDGKINFRGITKNNTRCYLYFDKQKLASETILATNELVNENGYRYEGLNPNNYVTFNDETWRIIGVFDTTVVDETTNAQKQEQLIKIIRDESIGDIAWDSDNGNDWSKASLQALLNSGDYYNRSGSYSNNGLTKESKEMIKNVVWNLGGAPNSIITAEAMYTAERSENKYGSNPTTWIGKVGLMYPSDYGYASPASTCDRATILYCYDISECYDKNWLFNGNLKWTITSISYNSSSAFTVNYHGLVNDTEDVHYSYAVRPSLYLKSSVQIVDGDGSSSHPYTLKN